MINRCVAKTNSGERCRNTAAGDDAICGAHARCDTVALSVVPEYELTVEGFGHNDEPGEKRWEHCQPEALTLDSACDKAVDEAVGGLGEFSTFDDVGVAPMGGEPDVFGPYEADRPDWSAGQSVPVPDSEDSDAADDSTPVAMTDGGPVTADRIRSVTNEDGVTVKTHSPEVGES